LSEKIGKQLEVENMKFYLFTGFALDGSGKTGTGRTPGRNSRP
jgi:hypothetical protein